MRGVCSTFCTHVRSPTLKKERRKSTEAEYRNLVRLRTVWLQELYEQVQISTGATSSGKERERERERGVAYRSSSKASHGGKTDTVKIVHELYTDRAQRHRRARSGA